MDSVDVGVLVVDEDLAAEAEVEVAVVFKTMVLRNMLSVSCSYVGVVLCKLLWEPLCGTCPPSRLPVYVRGWLFVHSPHHRACLS